MGRTKYPIRPDFKRWEHMNPPLNRVAIPLTQKLLGALAARQRSTPELTVTHRGIPAADGGEICGIWYEPVGITPPASCVLYCHGGGFVLPASPHHYSLAREYASRCPCKVLFINYRLAPGYPFPAAPEDCYAAYCWLIAHAAQLGVAPNRIAVAGDSAGGALATAVCLMARDRGNRIPCAQMLIYPVTAIGLETESMKRYTDTPMCNSRDMKRYGELYLRDRKPGNWAYASPIHAETLAELPPAYIETAEFDCLRDEAVLYGARAREYGVPVEVYHTSGTMHGFDIVQTSPLVRQCVDRRVSFLQRVFRDGQTEPGGEERDAYVNGQDA